MAKQDYRIGDFIGRFTSRHICESCGSVIYNANDPMRGTFCLTPGCDNALPPQFVRVTGSRSGAPQLFRELDEMRADVITEIKRWDRGFLVRELVAARSKVFKDVLTTGMTKIPTLLTIERALLLINQAHPEGKHSHVSDLANLRDQISALNNSESNVENIQLGRTVFAQSRIMAHENDGYFVLDLAYMLAFNSDLSAYGLVSDTLMTQEEIDETFTYADIDFFNYGIEDDKVATDAVKSFEKLAPTGILLTRMYSTHWWSSQMHKHDRNPFAVSILYGWFLQSLELDEIYRNDDPNLEQSLDERFGSVPDSNYSGAEFLAEYVDSSILVPYIPRCPEGLLLDRMTLLMMCIYLYVQEVPAEYQNLSGYSRFQQIFSMKRSDRFVDRLEAQLAERGYAVPVKEREIGGTGTKREFDLIAVDERHKSILLIEAKFKDVPASSVNCEDLVPNELEGEGAMLYELVRQNERKTFVLSNPELMTAECHLESPFDEYDVQAFIVSKCSPILDSLEDVRWFRADNFLELIESN